jgi:hypothetical protein
LFSARDCKIPSKTLLPVDIVLGIGVCLVAVLKLLIIHLTEQSVLYVLFLGILPPFYIKINTMTALSIRYIRILLLKISISMKNIIKIILAFFIGRKASIGCAASSVIAYQRPPYFRLA